MKKVFFFSILIFLFALPALSQEVIVFANDRSMIVKSHREKDGFVYLMLSEGEIAVPKKQIKEIRKESAAALSVSNADSPKLTSEAPIKPSLAERKKPIQPLKNVISKRVTPQQKNDDSDEEDEGEDNDEVDEDDDEDVASTPSEENKPRPLMPMKFPSGSDGTGRGPRLAPVNRKR